MGTRDRRYNIVAFCVAGFVLRAPVGVELVLEDSLPSSALLYVCVPLTERGLPDGTRLLPSTPDSPSLWTADNVPRAERWPCLSWVSFLFALSSSLPYAFSAAHFSAACENESPFFLTRSFLFFCSLFLFSLWLILSTADPFSSPPLVIILSPSYARRSRSSPRWMNCDSTHKLNLIFTQDRQTVSVPSP